MTGTAEVVHLQAPLSVEGRTIDTVTVRRPKVGDLRRMEKVKGGDLDKTLWLIATLTELSPTEVDELDAADMKAIGDIIEGFTGGQGA